MTQESDVAKRRLSAFVSRVEALSPEEWGRLDAAGQRFLAADPAGFLDRSLHIGRAMRGLTGAGELLTVPAVAALQVGGWVFRNISDGVRIVLDLPEPAALAPSVAEAMRRESARRSAGAEAGSTMPEFIERVATSALDAAGGDKVRKGADPAFIVLFSALTAVYGAERMGAETTARMYAPVEPVIPWSSLDDDPPTEEIYLALPPVS